MKITRRQLRKLIREALILEQNRSREYNVELVKWLEKNPEQLGRALSTVDIIPAAKALVSRIPGIELEPGHAFLGKYDKMKKESGLAHHDQYFHYIGFCKAAVYLREGGWPDERIEDFLVNGMSVGSFKEWLDHVNPGLGEAATSLWNVGLDKSLIEFAKDMNINREGVRQAIALGDCAEGAREWANQSQIAKVGHLKQRGFKGGDRDAFMERYGWAIEEYPDLYADDQAFIQPRYHQSLTGAQRAEAKQRYNSWSQRAGELAQQNIGGDRVSLSMAKRIARRAADDDDDENDNGIHWVRSNGKIFTIMPDGNITGISHDTTPGQLANEPNPKPIYYEVGLSQSLRMRDQSYNSLRSN